MNCVSNVKIFQLIPKENTSFSLLRDLKFHALISSHFPAFTTSDVDILTKP